MSVSALAARLPDVPTLIAWSQSMAMLDAILSPEWEMRYFSYDAHWAPGEHMASMRNGSGDEYSFTITPRGTYGRGFDHESALSPYTRQPPRPYEGLIDAVPSVLRDAVAEPAFMLGDVPSVTLTLWRLDGDGAWSCGKPLGVLPTSGDDGGTWLFDELDGKPETYRAFAADYYETPVSLGAAAYVFQHRPLTDAVVRSLNADLSVDDLNDDIRSIGYPQP
ncbi:MAG TPA: hypothetical protein VNA30_02290 [Mycobacteriales bacterium]|nr:hypothetical protein [Mycobacteriales bacterium]